MWTVWLWVTNWLNLSQPMRRFRDVDMETGGGSVFVLIPRPLPVFRPWSR